MKWIDKLLNHFKKEEPPSDVLTEKMVRDFLTLWKIIPKKYSMSGFLHIQTDQEWNIISSLKDEFNLHDDGNCLKTETYANITIFKPHI